MLSRRYSKRHGILREKCKEITNAEKEQMFDIAELVICRAGLGD